MSDYNSLKNSALTNPTGNLDLGSATNRYGNIFLQGNLAIGNLVATETSLVSPKISSLTYAGNDTAADPTGSQTITVNGSGFSSGAAVYVAGSVASSVTVVSSTQVTFSSPAKSAGNYTLILVNADGGTATFIPGMQYSGVPSWSTSSGSLANVYESGSVSSTLSATSDSTVSYSVTSGALPTGVTLTSGSGVIAGTAPSQASGSTTYNFTASAIDGENQDTPRNFSVTVNADAVTWSSPADSTTYSLEQGIAMANVELSATSAAGKSITYTANSLPTGLSISGSNIVGTPTVAASTSSTLTATASTTNKTATKVVNWTVAVASDAYFKSVSLLLNGETPTSTWLSDASTNNLLVTNKSDFRTNASVIPASRTPYNTATYPTAGSAWFAGEGPDGPGAYDTLSFQMPQLGTVFTVELWFYADEASPGLTATKNLLISNGGFNISIVGNKGLSAGTSGNMFQTATNVFSAYTWNHVAVVRTGTGAGEFKMYLNGTLVTLSSGAFTSATTPLTSAEARIGGNTSGYQNLLRGNIADLRIVNGTAVYTANFAAPTAPLTAISGTVFLSLQYQQGSTNSSFVDSSTNALTIRRYGNATQGTFSPFSPTGWSAYFDGSGDYLTTTGFGLSTDFTVEFWSYFTAQPTGGYFMSASSSGPIIGLETSKTIVGSNGGWILNPPNDSAVYPNGVAPINQWNHWALVRSSGTMTFYLNGVKLGSAANTADYSASQTWGIGAANDGSPVNVPHYMSNFRISNVARYSGTSVIGANFTLPTADFVNDINTTLLTLQSNRFKDNSTSPKAITTVGDTKAQAVSPFAPTTAYSAATYGGSMYFDGNDNLDGAANNANMQMGTGDYTVEGWFYQSTLYSTYGTVFEIGAGTSGTGGIQFSIGNQSQGGVRIYAYNGTNGYVGGFITNPPLNTWNHIAWVRSSGVMKIYLNGVGNAGGAHTGDLTDSSTVTVGGEFSRNASFTYNGYISDLRVVKGTAVYTSNFTPPTGSLTAILGTSLLLKGTNAGIADATGRNDLETVGYTTAEPGRRQPEISTQVKKYGNSSIYFSGASSDRLSIPASPNVELAAGNFTIEFWMNASSVTGTEKGIFGIGTQDPDSNLVRISTGSKLQFWLGGSNSSGPGAGTKTGIITCSTTIAVDTWYHVALVRSGTGSNNVKLYLNGSLDGQGTATYNIGAKQFSLGMGYPTNATEFYTGYIDDFRITKGVARYTANFTPPTAKFNLR